MHRQEPAGVDYPRNECQGITKMSVCVCVVRRRPVRLFAYLIGIHSPMYQEREAQNGQPTMLVWHHTLLARLMLLLIDPLSCPQVRWLQTSQEVTQPRLYLCQFKAGSASDRAVVQRRCRQRPWLLHQLLLRAGEHRGPWGGCSRVRTQVCRY